VCFYELGVRLLKPGDLLCFVVTNKWMKAGYAQTPAEIAPMWQTAPPCMAILPPGWHPGPALSGLPRAG
jgi:hypothetical protein